jgi:hypothetical protein
VVPVCGRNGAPFFTFTKESNVNRDEHSKKRAEVHHDRYEDAMRAARNAADPDIADVLYDEACVELALYEALSRAADGFASDLDELASICTGWLGELAVAPADTIPFLVTTVTPTVNQ